MPFRSRPGQPVDLLAQIDVEMRERIQEAVDHVSLTVLVERRRREGRPPPEPDNRLDRVEFETGGEQFLRRLQAELMEGLAEEQRRKVDEAAARAGSDPRQTLLAVQAVLARQLPDYWQRFDRIRVAHSEEDAASGGDRRGRLGRLFGR